MKKTIALVAMLLMAAYSFAAYQVGDFVTDFSFQDTNLEGSNVVTYDHTVSGMTGTDKKVLFMTYFFPG